VNEVHLKTQKPAKRMLKAKLYISFVLVSVIQAKVPQLDAKTKGSLDG
jgi:hypothetical protein